MTRIRTLLACALALGAASFSSFAQVGDSSCILAGRLDAQARWAPRLAGVELLGQEGRAISASGKQALAGVKQVRLSAPALLSRCDGDKELALGPDAPGSKSPGPAAAPGTYAVEAVAFPKLRRAGEMVELKLTVPADRVVMVTR